MIVCTREIQSSHKYPVVYRIKPRGQPGCHELSCKSMMTSNLSCAFLIFVSRIVWKVDGVSSSAHTVESSLMLSFCVPDRVSAGVVASHIALTLQPGRDCCLAFTNIRSTLFIRSYSMMLFMKFIAYYIFRLSRPYHYHLHTIPYLIPALSYTATGFHATQRAPYLTSPLTLLSPPHFKSFTLLG